MQFNFLGFVNRVLNMCRQTPVTTFAGLTEASDAKKVMVCVNDTLQDLSNLLRVRGRLTTFSFPTVASQRVYCLPKSIEFPIYDLVQQTDDIKLEQFDTNYYDNLLPNPSSWSGNPTAYYLEGFYGVQTQPASTGEIISIVSDNSSDTSINCTIQGYDTSNNYIEEEITLSGTVSVNSTNTYKTISNIYKDSSSGKVTFTGSVSTTTFLTLTPSENSILFAHIGLHPIPSTVITIYGRGYARIPSLTNEYSVPVGLTERHINAIVLGSYARYIRYDAKFPQEAIPVTFQSYYDEIKKIVAMESLNPDLLTRMKRGNEIGNFYRFRPLDRESV